MAADKLLSCATRQSGRKGADNVRSDELQMSLGLRAFLGEVLTAVLGMPAR